MYNTTNKGCDMMIKSQPAGTNIFTFGTQWYTMFYTNFKLGSMKQIGLAPRKYAAINTCKCPVET